VPVSAAQGRRSAFAGAAARAGCDPNGTGSATGRLKILLQREGFAVNHKRVYRLYVEEKLGLRRKRGRRTDTDDRSATCAPEATAVRPDEVWTMDFTQDAFASGRKFRTLNLMDGFTRYAPRIEVDTSLPGQRVVRVLEELKQRGRKPEAIVIDNGTEFTSQVVDQWAYENQVQLHFITPGRPMENGFIESFNGKFRDECLNENWFMDLADAREQDRGVAVRLQSGAAALGPRVSHPGGVRKIVGGDGLWKRRSVAVQKAFPLGKRSEGAGFPRIIKGRPFEVGFECDAKLYRKEHPYGH
jgi:transposase InsO family protein